MMQRVTRQMWELNLAASVALCLTASTAGCASASGPKASQIPSSMEARMNVTLASIVEAVLADAAKRTGLPAGSLAVADATAVTWADGSLGCPESGMSYTMALVPGYRIRVQAGQQFLDYHASQRGYFVLCAPGRSVDPVGDVEM